MGSFLQFVSGFLLFIAVSFGVTFAVSVYTQSQQKEQVAAAALAAFLHH